jgi:RNA recognition motif-containing protein
MNLFVARLNPATTAKDLQNLFSHYGGVITAKVIFDRNTGRSKRYGFVEMPMNHEAHEAIKELNNTLFHDRSIEVKVSRPSGYGIYEIESLYQNHKNQVQSLGIHKLQKKKLNSATIYKPQRDNNSRRNYGYRGSGYKDFK